ncbi:MAG TPA: hypothetical protein DEG17_24835 [Cyanobacteria bacterium UBA11149]|nr:hypothetical protein [Cyanobacteria bacterium UBA11367]HBE56639.1 hypothetical protein [Cyanobacteria bacterium UBA11366]HBK65155.1 hypothetical protein [Cyanobacteria bacterium UBA11166]HBR74781.1 hypothetical protein [Cyanobacteria bacterium UBA11159]HBS70029.1 hypothetical protein [Cyanobacteria bacterium UBA11153]HBW92005.1 hypothetical protein [Cyanobacteria bacterium UBA11149]HCA95910.1 hypothetical protein [Cyanobacteria bacterium UBA9226]
MNDSLESRLEKYTLKHPQEVLIVTVRIGEEEDRIAIFKGFSSSLMRPTAFDPDVPLLPEDAEIISIDRVASPYNPNRPRYIEQGLSGDAIAKLLSDARID